VSRWLAARKAFKMLLHGAAAVVFKGLSELEK
jgi:hypothetical protein